MPDAPAADALLLKERDALGIATVTLNRPHKLNALTRPMWRELGAVFAELSADDDLRCVVLRGAGGRAFSPGNDIAEFECERANSEQARAYGADMRATLEAIGGCRHPVVALIEGVCVGGGLELAALADVRICGESSRFGAPIGRLGLVMSPAELNGLLRLVGRATTLEILLEGRVFGAAEALRKGIVNRVVPDGEVVAQAYECAGRIARLAPLVARWHKQMVARLESGAPLTSAEEGSAFECFDSEDFQIGYRAFLDKRQPKFVGR